MRRRGLRIVVLLLLASLLPFALRYYMLQEIVIVLLGLALVFVALMPFLVAFVVLQGGMRRALPWLRSSLTRLAAWSHMQLWANRLRARF